MKRPHRRYFEEVAASLQKYERLNREAVTITRQPTEEETAQYDKIQANIKYIQYCIRDESKYGGRYYGLYF
jgi:hypothetical protein